MSNFPVMQTSQKILMDVKSNSLVNRLYRIVLPILGIWLVGWMILSWAGIQDDALIHLRYADNLLHTHLISYDGVHASYGTSSLLYVHLIAFLRSFTESPNLPRAVSSLVHLTLVLGLGLAFVRFVPSTSSLARLLGLVLLYILVAPSSVRWLEDGMETGLALCFVTLLSLATFRQSRRSTPTALEYVALTALAFFTVLLRTELALLCGIAFLILVSKEIASTEFSSRTWFRVIVRSSHLPIGCLLAFTFILVRMHHLLPDTALAKANGASWQEFWGAWRVAGEVLASAMSFGAGMLLLWLLTLLLVWRSKLISAQTVLANVAFPVVLLLAALRGQQIQGARYLVWAYFFSVVWNIFELSRAELDRAFTRSGLRLIYGFAVLLLIALPIESKTMYRVTHERVETMREFEGQNLGILQGKRGTAFDIGYIGYFSKADICDLAGLVNGRAAARLDNDERAAACASTHPDFVFGSLGELMHLSQFLPLGRWQVCSSYDFGNVTTPDTHYLLLPEATSSGLCKAISGATPYPVEELHGWRG